MIRSVVTLSALIFGSALLMFAGGMHGLILPLRGSYEGFSSFSLGLLGAGWAVGYMGGCVYTPRVVRRVGHIRTFTALAAVAAITILASLLLLQPLAWLPLRAVAGFCFSGAAMIFESWLNERSDDDNRGRLFGTYMMVNLVATTLGQLVITLGDKTGFVFFVLAGIFYTLSLIPPALTSTAAPTPLVQIELNIGELMRNSRLATIGIILTGVSNGAFMTLGVVYAEQLQLDITTIVLFMSLSLLAGAMFQLPVGYLSDSCDRRLVLVWLAGMAAAVELYFLVVQPITQIPVLIAVSLFGAAIYSMYPVIVAHAYDRAAPENYIQISGGLLLLFGAGSVAGPVIAGGLMATAGKSGLFFVTLGAHIGIIAYGIRNQRVRELPSDADKTEFAAAPLGELTTPETAVFDPRTPEIEAFAASSGWQLAENADSTIDEQDKKIT